jgi:hypothetical protein
MKKGIMLMSVLFALGGSTAMAQTQKQNVDDAKRKEDAAKADVYIINSQKKLTDSITTKSDSTTIIASGRTKKNCADRCHKKSSSN